MQPPFNGRTQNGNQEEDVFEENILGLDAAIEGDREKEDEAHDG
jgi:hypothetical protein